MNLKEIAKIAGVSISTVSLVLNNKDGVGDETRARVKKLLKENGYTIKRENRSWAYDGSIVFIRYIGSGQLIGPNDNFLNLLLESAKNEARRQNYALVIANSYPDTIEYDMKEIVNTSANGIIFLGTELDPELSKILLTSKIPIISIDTFYNSYVNYSKINSVDIDNFASVYLAIDHFYNLGHRNIGYLSSIEQTGSIPIRAEMFNRAMNDYELKINPNNIIKFGLNPENIHHEFKKYIKTSKDLPTAFLADKDTIAAACMRSMYSQGLKVPEDVSIISFDNSSISHLTNPPLSSLNIQGLEVGTKAVQRLIEIINGDDIILKCQVCTPLIERHSTAPPKI